MLLFTRCPRPSFMDSKSTETFEREARSAWRWHQERVDGTSFLTARLRSRWDGQTSVTLDVDYERDTGYTISCMARTVQRVASAMHPAFHTDANATLTAKSALNAGGILRH